MSNPVGFYRINSICSCLTGAIPAAYLHEIKSTERNVALSFHKRFLCSIFCRSVPRFDFISTLLENQLTVINDTSRKRGDNLETSLNAPRYYTARCNLYRKLEVGKMLR